MYFYTKGSRVAHLYAGGKPACGAVLQYPISIATLAADVIVCEKCRATGRPRAGMFPMNPKRQKKLSKAAIKAQKSSPAKPNKPPVQHKPILQTPGVNPALKAIIARCGVDPRTPEFLETFQWRAVRMLVLKKYGARCQCCGASAATGAVIHIDHVKPRKLFPELALDVENCQCLCAACNHGKGNWDQTDWR